jgi:hypothetical protein
MRAGGRLIVFDSPAADPAGFRALPGALTGLLGGTWTQTSKRARYTGGAGAACEPAGPWAVAADGKPPMLITTAPGTVDVTLARWKPGRVVQMVNNTGPAPLDEIVPLGPIETEIDWEGPASVELVLPGSAGQILPAEHAGGRLRPRGWTAAFHNPAPRCLRASRDQRMTSTTQSLAAAFFL